MLQIVSGTFDTFSVNAFKSKYVLKICLHPKINITDILKVSMFFHDIFYCQLQLKIEDFHVFAI